MSVVVKAKTALALGLFNLFRVFKYRIGVKTGLNSVQKLTAQMPIGGFFLEPPAQSVLPSHTKVVQLTAFGYLHYVSENEYPNWFYSPLTTHTFQNVIKPWYAIPDFDEKVGDIKGIWEASRFDWVLQFIQEERLQNNGLALQRLDLWLNNWCEQNPAYKGPNWKCGQEASIRVMHLIAALIGLGALKKPSVNIVQLIELHLQRIAPTIDYAIAQDNNHGTSEATALFMGGGLLNQISPKKQYKAWEILGRKWLENRAIKIIMQDGGFSQYSVNYHRVMLDSYCLAESLRQKLNLAQFSDTLYKQLKKATDWLYVLTQDNGDVPNIGANDGARLIPVCHTDYRDFRPTVQFASTLFHQHSYYQQPDTYDEVLTFFKIDKKSNSLFKLPIRNQFFNKSGLITVQKNNFFIAFKLPIFKFRPSQCDALHIDLWWNGKNVLRDGGTYSYNSTVHDLDYFSGVESHNTVQFDQHNQMPRLSRFLFGAWLKPNVLEYQPYQFKCGYQDYWGCQHTRKVDLVENKIIISDDITGFKYQAVLRLRLQPGQWKLEGNVLSNSELSIAIQTDAPIDIRLIEGEESRYYYQKTYLPVLELIVKKPTNIITVIQELT